MKFVAVIQKRCKIPDVVVVYAEEEMYAYDNLNLDYPKHRVLHLKRVN